MNADELIKELEIWNVEQPVYVENEYGQNLEIESVVAYNNGLIIKLKGNY